MTLVRDSDTSCSSSDRQQTPRRVVIVGAAGRDSHNFSMATFADPWLARVAAP